MEQERAEAERIIGGRRSASGEQRDEVGWGLGKPGGGVYFCAIQLRMPSHVGWGPGGEFARRTRTHDTDTRPVFVICVVVVDWMAT